MGSPGPWWPGGGGGGEDAVIEVGLWGHREEACRAEGTACATLDGTQQAPCTRGLARLAEEVEGEAGSTRKAWCVRQRSLDSNF